MTVLPHYKGGCIDVSLDSLSSVIKVGCDSLDSVLMVMPLFLFYWFFNVKIKFRGVIPHRRLMNSRNLLLSPS